MISGGSLTLSSSDDGITVADTLDITGDTDINIKTCYEGIEAGTINIGTKDSQSGPDIVIYSNDDGINASSKSSTTYVYADESEEKYTKTTIPSPILQTVTIIFLLTQHQPLCPIIRTQRLMFYFWVRHILLISILINNGGDHRKFHTVFLCCLFQRNASRNFLHILF